MSIYTEETLDKLNKKELVTFLLSLQSKAESANNEILDQVPQLNQKFSQLKAKYSVVKQANSLLSKRLVDMERQCWANAQWVFLTVFRITNWKTKCLPFSKRLVVKYLHVTLTHTIVSERTMTE